MAKKAKKKVVKTMKMDPKHIGVPNICFSLTDVKDKREKAFAKQRLKHGFDDSETWALNTAIARFTLPRLKRFKEISPCVPGLMSQEEWYQILDGMIEAMELVIRDCDGHGFLDKKERAKMNAGLKLFAKHFRGLWW